MRNKKGFAGMLISIIIAMAIIVVLFLFWQKMSNQGVRNVTEEAAKNAGIQLNPQSATPQGEVDAVRDFVNKVQDKKNAEIESELNK